MTPLVIAEGPFDVLLLKRLLPPELSKEARFVAGGGIEGVKSLARSVAVSSPTPLAIVIDADTSDPDLIRARTQSMNDLVASVTPIAPFRVIVAVPEIEYVFFEAPDMLRRVFPDAPDFELITQIARSNTREALTRLDPGTAKRAILQKLLDGVDNDYLHALRQTKVVRELVEFLLSCQRRHVAIRIEIGPGYPADLNSLKTRDGLQALFDAMVSMLSTEQLAPGAVLTGSSGDTTVAFHPRRTAMKIEPPGNIFATFVLEMEGEADVKQLDHTE